MRLLAWNGRLPGRSRWPRGFAQATGTLIQAAQTDTSQALNPKSLVSTTNKLQQFVAEFERLECFTLRQHNVPVVIENRGVALLALSRSARSAEPTRGKQRQEQTYPIHRESCELVDADRDHLPPAASFPRGRPRFDEGAQAARPLGLARFGSAARTAKPMFVGRAAKGGEAVDGFPSRRGPAIPVP